MNLLESIDDEFVEVDPTGRYRRYNDVLGRGSSKIVYRGFDEYEGIEVAWNQVKLYNFLQSPEELQRLYNEIHLLKTLEHNNIMKFYSSWVDTSKNNINFVTEMFTSGTLKQYRQKHKRVNIRAVKNWCGQILEGLCYLHSHEPPVIHRDLKCDNIFINGNHGEVKIGDLGLAAMLDKADAAHCVGTPEFMAPEVYQEEYNQLVDIYAFGMCVLEMVTFEYPYSECNHPAEIYKKVVSGRKPDALYKVKDPEVRRFVEKCLVTVSRRLSARELLMDPFLQIDGDRADPRLMGYLEDIDEMGPLTRQPLYQLHHDTSSLTNRYPYDYGHCLEARNEWQCGNEQNGIGFFTNHGDEPSSNLDISIKGQQREGDSVYLRLRITDNEGCIRNIYFSFDIENDTALSVATEMVGELEITDQDVTRIAEMIDGEILSMVPEWIIGPCLIETPRSFARGGFCFNCASLRTSTGSLVEYPSSYDNEGTNNLQVGQCSQYGCASMHSRFEEITYPVEGSINCLEEITTLSNHSNDKFYHHESTEVSSLGSRVASCDEEPEQFVQSTSSHNDRMVDKNIISMPKQDDQNERNSMLCSPESGCSSTFSSTKCIVSDDYEKEVGQEMRWLKARYQLELRELRSKQLEGKPKTWTAPLNPNHEEQGNAENSVTCSSILSHGDFLRKSLTEWKPSNAHSPAHVQNCCPNAETRNEATPKPFDPEDIFTAKSFYTGALLPLPLHRTTSLPVDADM